ncbi:sterol desaturase family protein [Gordonia sp. 'Campus']|uniref:sterol desaturase family protein n=1 Tax=Gordonia sp. 'Campus' TaxID=2915824 RepID=UPI001EE4AF63|nr:sterol desaturase family protein [Gordonia sp. 'Campus']
MSTDDLDAERIDNRARRQVAAEERRMRSRRSMTLRAAFAEFLRHPSPWIMFGFFSIALAARTWLGDWGIADLLVPVVMIASFPAVEWLIHVFVLHWRPKRLGPVTIDPLVARKHREHHSDPRDIPLVFIPWQVLVTVVLVAVAVGLVVFASPQRGLTFMTVLAAIGLVYEWTHYLIHSDYRPRHAFYRRLWRNHRFHHYRNEHYWFAVTTAGTVDRLLHTYPDPESVEKSPTAKDLHALRDRPAVRN